MGAGEDRVAETDYFLALPHLKEVLLCERRRRWSADKRRTGGVDVVGHGDEPVAAAGVQVARYVSEKARWALTLGADTGRE